MARVAQDPKLRGSVEHYLDHLVRHWESIPELAAEWDDWDEESRLTFVANEGVPSDRLGSLRQWAAQGLLTPEQWRRYEQLERLVAEHRPKLEHLLVT